MVNVFFPDDIDLILQDCADAILWLDSFEHYQWLAR